MGGYAEKLLPVSIVDFYLYGPATHLQVRLVRELEKKFSGRPVVFVAQRRILPKPKRNQRTRQKQLRPRRYVDPPHSEEELHTTVTMVTPHFSGQ